MQKNHKTILTVGTFINAMIPLTALVLSVLSIYLQYGDPSDEVLASVLRLEGERDGLSASIALINAGERPAVVHAIEVMWAEYSKNCERPLQFRMVKQPGVTEGLPALLEPEHMEVISLRGPFLEELKGRDLQDRLCIGLKFASLDSAGARFTAISSVAEASPGKSGVKLERIDKTIDLLEAKY